MWQWIRRMCTDPDDDLELEIRSHLETEADESRECGLSPEEARLSALRAFGNRAFYQEETRAVWTWMWAEYWIRDLRLAMRALLRKPTFLMLSTSALALGIGATSAVFAIVHAVLLKPLPYPHTGRIVVLQDQLLNDQ